MRGGEVNALALSEGTLWVAGLFDSVGGEPHPNLAVDAATGAPRPWAPGGANGELMDLTVDAGRVYVASIILADLVAGDAALIEQGAQRSADRGVALAL